MRNSSSKSISQRQLFYKTLEKNRIQILYSSQFEPLRLKKPANAQALQESTLLWEDPWTQVYLPSHPRVPHHLWITLKKEKSSFLEVSKEEISQLHATLRRVIGILHKHYGIFDYVLTFSNHPKNKQILLELIPPRPDAQDVLDLEDKISCNSYVVIPNEAHSRFMDISQEDLQQMAQEWRKNLQEEESITPIPKKEIGVHIHKQKKMSYLVENLFHALKKRGISIEREIHSEPLGDEIEIKHPKKPCLFCNAELLSTQSVFENAKTRVLYNLRPFVKGAHFLVIPAKHRSRFIDLSSGDFCEMMEMAKAVISTMEILHGRNDAILYVQDGFVVGQTVFHSHIHVLLPPDPIRHLFFSLSYEDFPTPSLEYFEMLRAKMTPILKKEYFAEPTSLHAQSPHRQDGVRKPS